MKLPLTIAAQDFDLTDPIEAIIRDKATKLEKFNGRVIGCHVIVQGPSKHHRHGGPYAVRIDLTVPGHEYVINQKEDPDLHLVIRDAFDAARRKLDEDRELYLERRKAPPAPIDEGQVDRPDAWISAPKG
ncbi:MAG TPA: HPF/RaiA family ribosome-associated protein [Thermoanaerobaculia bacterium]|nr:HPF/RaiA family ribosome-associated protein [Thermoanaerobaculia bacterium]